MIVGVRNYPYSDRGGADPTGPALREALYHIEAVLRFAGIDPGREAPPNM